MVEKPIQTPTQVVPAVKKVKEEIYRFTYVTPGGGVAAGTEFDYYPFESAAGQHYDIRIGECGELIAMGIEPVTGLGETRIRNRDNTRWNTFYTSPGLNANQLPFNMPQRFEQKAMSWGYRSILHHDKDLAPTLKLPEGDQMRISGVADAAGGGIAGATTIYGCAVMRRYLYGSQVNYKGFDQYDGGLKSQKQYYNDWQYLATTLLGQWTTSWQLQLLRNECYKFFNVGILPDHMDPTGAACRLQQARLMIDQPTILFNSYYVNRTRNTLPFVSTHNMYMNAAFVGDYYQNIENEHRLIPTVDIVKDTNKDLTMQVRDDGVGAAVPVITRFTGVKYQKGS